MKLSLEWIKEYTDIPAEVTVERLMYDLTMSTVEVEGAERVRDRFRHIDIGLIKEVLPHPNADRLRICRTDVGGGEVREIVCGGINLEPGMKVAVSKPGAMVRWHGEGEPVEVKVAKLRGVESYGMICASTEIGLFDLFPFTEPSTIVDLSHLDAEPGTNVAEALGIDDVILEIDNKSMTNRPDLWGHWGIARELAAIYGTELKKWEMPSLPASDGGLRVKVDDATRCMRYRGLVIEGLDTREASFKVRSRLWLVGQRPINAIVDITNYVMLATGQPSHAFDRDNIKGGITVRMAREGERLALLNGRELTMTASDQVIADDVEAVGLAGIMGGSKDSILPDTKSVILEVATFDALGTRRTATRYDLRTEASSRYEKGIDTDRTDQAVALSVKMFAEAFPDMRISGSVDVYPSPTERAKIDVSLTWLEARTGRRTTADEASSLLGRLGFEVASSGDVLRVTAPSWRSTGDISIRDDIMEEICRLYGYENFEQSPITTAFTASINQPRVTLGRAVKEYLSLRCGMNEVFTYPWVRDDILDAIGADRSEMLEISTPPSPTERMLRSSLIPGMIGTIAGNARYFSDLAVYEMTQVYFDRGFSAPYDERERLPEQRMHLAGALASDREDAVSLFRRAKGIVEHMPRFTHMEPFTVTDGDRPKWADDTVCVAVNALGGSRIGTIALLDKRTALACGIKQHAAVIFELDASSFVPLASRNNRFARLPEHPMAETDISMLFDEDKRWHEIRAAAIGDKGGGLVRSVDYIGEYRGKQIPAGKKSVTLRLTIGAPDRTLTGDEIEHASAAVAKRLTKTLGGEMRG